MKRYGHVTSGQQLGSSEQTAGPDSHGMTRPRHRQHLQFARELQAAEGLGLEEQVSSLLIRLYFRISKTLKFHIGMLIHHSAL